MIDLEPPAPPVDLKVREVGRRLRVSRRTVYRLIDDKQFPGTYKLRGSYRIPQDALEGYIASRKVNE